MKRGVSVVSLGVVAAMFLALGGGAARAQAMGGDAAKDATRVDAGDGRAERAPQPPASAAPLAAPAVGVEDAFRAIAPAAGETAPETRVTMPAPPTPRRRPAETAQMARAQANADAALFAPDPPQLEAPFAEAPERREEGRPFSDRRFPIGRSAHLATIRSQATALNVPIDLVDAVATVESGYDPHAVGVVDEIGMMQVRPATARQLGFEGSAQDLFEPETNIRLGATYLAGAWERAGGNLCQALMKYRAGWEETRMSALSLEYCRRALVHLTAIGSPLARGATLPPVTRPGVSEDEPSGRRTASRFNWREHDRRLQEIDRRFGGSNFGIIAR